MTSPNINDWQKYTWRNRPRYKSKPQRSKRKVKSFRIRFLKKKRFFYSKNTYSKNKHFFSYWLLFHNSFINLPKKQSTFVFDSTKYRFNPIFMYQLQRSINFNSVSFSRFLFCFLKGKLTPLLFSHFTTKIFLGWMLFFRLTLFSKELSSQNINIFNSYFFSAFEKYHRMFFSYNLSNIQWNFFLNKYYWSSLSLNQKVIFFSISNLFLWNVLQGSSKKIWMSLSNSYCVFYFYTKDFVLFDASKTIQALKRAFYFLTSSINRGSHAVFISWRFSDEFRSFFYSCIKNCYQSGSYGWIGGNLTNAKRLGLFSNLYFKLSFTKISADNSLFAHEWLKVPYLFQDVNCSHVTFSDKQDPMWYDARGYAYAPWVGPADLQPVYIRFFSILKKIFISSIYFFSSYSFINLKDIVKRLNKNILQFINNINLWFFFSKVEEFTAFFGRLAYFRTKRAIARLITKKKELPIIIKDKNYYTKVLYLKRLPNVTKKLKLNLANHSKLYWNWLWEKKIKRIKKISKKFFYKKNLKQKLCLKYPKNMILIRAMQKPQKRLKPNNFRPLKQKNFFLNQKTYKSIRTTLLIKRFKPLIRINVKHRMVYYSKFKRRRRLLLGKSYWKRRFSFKHPWTFFLFFKKNFRKWKKFRIKKKIKRWLPLKSKSLLSPYTKLNKSFKKLFNKLFPTMAILLNSSNLSMAQNDVINLKMPSIGLLNSSNNNGYFTYSIPANDESEISSIFHLSIFKSAILKGYFLKKKLFFDNI